MYPFTQNNCVVFCCSATAGGRRCLPSAGYKSLIVLMVLSQLDNSNVTLSGCPENQYHRLQFVVNAAASSILICSGGTKWRYPWSNVTGWASFIKLISRSPCLFTIVFTILLTCSIISVFVTTLLADMNSAFGHQLTPTFFWYCCPGWLMLIIHLWLPGREHGSIRRKQLVQHRSCHYLMTSYNCYIFGVVFLTFSFLTYHCGSPRFHFNWCRQM